MFAILRNIIMAMVITAITVIIGCSWASAGTVIKVDLGYGHVLEVERLDEHEDHPNGMIYLACITLKDESIEEGVMLNGMVDVSSGTIPQMYLKSLDLTTNNGFAYVYGFQHPEDLATIVSWLSNINPRKHQELTLILDGDFCHFPVKVIDPKAAAEDIAKLLLCVK